MEQDKYARLVNGFSGQIDITYVHSLSEFRPYFLLTFTERGNPVALATVMERGWLGSVAVVSQSLPPIRTAQQASDRIQQITQNGVQSSVAAFAPGTLTGSAFLPFFVVRGAAGDVYYVAPHGDVFAEDTAGIDGTIAMSGIRRGLRRIAE